MIDEHAPASGRSRADPSTSARPDPDPFEVPARAVRAAVVVTEFPSGSCAPGRASRVATLTRWADLSGFSTDECSVLTRDARGGRLRRALSVLTWRPGPRLDHASVVVVSGLAAPHMLWLARRLAKRHTVVFDACDSWYLQAKAHATSRSPGIVWALLGWLVSRLPSRLVATSYISDRDAAGDSRPRTGARYVVIPPARRDDLQALPAVAYPLNRISVLTDATSFHNRTGLTEFLPALSSWALDAGVAVDLYGRTDGVPPMAGVTDRGWVPNLADAYRGATGVFVTNVGGSGVANKVLEANDAGRPLIMHESLGFMADRLQVPVFWFADPADLPRAVSACVAGPAEPFDGTRRDEPVGRYRALRARRPRPALRFARPSVDDLLPSGA